MTETRTRTRRPANTAGPLVVADVVIVSCSCGMFPLDRAMHRNATSAWHAAAAHVALNPTRCHPNMARSTAPVALAASLPL